MPFCCCLQLDVRDAAGATPLHLAADAAMAAVLLAAGAPVDAVNNAGETPLFGAAAANCEPLVLRLLAAGANVDHQDDCGETPLIRAASRCAHRPQKYAATIMRIVNVTV